VAALVIVAAGIAVALALRGPFFLAQTVEVHGASRLSLERVARIAGISDATNVVWLDEGAAERALEAHPWVADAVVDRHLPGTVEVRVRERVPVATVSTVGGFHLLAGDGADLGGASPERGLPVIQIADLVAAEDASAGAPAQAARAIGAVPPATRTEIARIRMGSDGMLQIVLGSGVRIAYGPAAEFAAKGRALAAVLRWAEQTGQKIAVADIRSPTAPTAKLESGGSIDV
jgi:cell division protein FtsQ